MVLLYFVPLQSSESIRPRTSHRHRRINADSWSNHFYYNELHDVILQGIRPFRCRDIGRCLLPLHRAVPRGIHPLTELHPSSQYGLMLSKLYPSYSVLKRHLLAEDDVAVDVGGLARVQFDVGIFGSGG